MLPDCFLPKRDAEVKAFQEKLLDPGLGFEVVVLEDYKNIALEEVVRRGVHRIRPANDNGEELRDVVIWLIALEHAKAKNSQVAFITDDGHFTGPGENFHPDLLQDLTTLIKLSFIIPTRFRSSLGETLLSSPSLRPTKLLEWWRKA